MWTLFSLLLLLPLFIHAAIYTVHTLYPQFKDWEIKRLSALKAKLHQDFLFVDVSVLRKIVRLTWLALVIFLLLIAGKFIAIASALGLIWAACVYIPHRIKASRKNKFERQLVLALPQMSAMLASGHSLGRAIETLSYTHPAPLGQEFQMILKEIQLGTSLEMALKHLCKRVVSHEMERLTFAITVSRRTGSNLSEVFAKVGKTLQSRFQLRERLRILTAQGRFQAWTAIALPIVVTLIIQWMDPTYLEPFFTTDLGRMLFLGSCVSLVVGGYWTHSLSQTELFE